MYPHIPVSSTLSVSASRFQSTVPAASSSAPSPTATADLPTTFDFGELSSYSTVPPDTIGYLKSLGLDYGIGPTSLLEWVLEHIHVWGHLPWWSSIVATALLLRVAAFPLMLKSADAVAKMAAVQTVTAPIRERMKQAQLNRDTLAVQTAQQELMQVFRSVGINPFSAFLPVVVQIPFGYATFKLTRAMASLPVPGLENAGILWFTDLTVADPYFILPVAVAGILHIQARVSAPFRFLTAQNLHHRFED